MLAFSQRLEAVFLLVFDLDLAFLVILLPDKLQSGPTPGRSLQAKLPFANFSRPLTEVHLIRVFATAL